MKKRLRLLCFLAVLSIITGFMSSNNFVMSKNIEYGEIINISWDHSSERKISHGVKSAEYGRLCFVSDNIWLLAYSFGPYLGKDGKLRGDGWSSIAVRRSIDAGETWSKPFIIPVPENYEGYWRFCTPEFIKLKSGRILLGYVGGGNPDDNEHDVFFIRYSDDEGLTWSEPEIVAKGRGWEPAFIQLDDGTVQMFYASEARWWPGNNVQQEILMIESHDNGKTWTENPKRVAYNPGKRDGMPVPVVLQNNKGMAFVIESVGAKNSPYVIWSSMDENWSSPVSPENGGPDSQHRWLATKDDIFGGAPYITQLPTGETILACHDKGYKNTISHWRKSVSMVYIGNDEAKDFQNLSYPWPYLDQEEGTIQNAIYALDSERVLLVSTKVKTNDNCEIWIKIGNIIRQGTKSITYNLNGGQNPFGAHTTYTEGTEYTLPVPVRNGYIFEGWYTNTDFSGNPVTEITESDTGDKEFFAKWVERTIVETPDETKGETPVDTPDETPANTPDETIEETMGATPADTPSQTPVESENETVQTETSPAATPDETNNETIIETPDEPGNNETISDSKQPPDTGDYNIVYILLFMLAAGFIVFAAIRKQFKKIS